MTAFATMDEVASGWRPLRPTERVWGQQLLDAAARWIRKPGHRPDIADDDPDAKLVSISVVRSALAPGANAGHTQYAKTAGSFQRSGTLTNPEGALRFSDWHKELLGLSTTAGPSWSFGDC